MQRRGLRLDVVNPGWADKFLTTAAAGVEDFYVGGNVTLGAVKLDMTWYDFAATF